MPKIAEYSDNEIVEALEQNWGLLFRTVKWLRKKNDGLDRKVSVPDLKIRLRDSDFVRERYEEIRGLIVDEAEYTVISRMMGDASTKSRDMTAAFALLERYGNWKSASDNDLPNVIVNLGPDFTTPDEWKTAFTTLVDRHGLPAEIPPDAETFIKN